MVTLKWNTATEWNNSQSESGTAHESSSNTGHSDASILQHAYSYSNPLYSSDLLAYWPLQETSGSTIYNKAGSDNMTINGGPTQGNTGPAGDYAYYFDGTDDWAESSNGYAVWDYTATVMIWVYFPVLPSGHIFTQAGDWGMHPTNDGTYWKPRFDVWGDNTKNEVTSSYNTGQWYHWAVTTDGANNEIKSYINGSLKGTTSSTDSSGSSGTVTLATRNNSAGFTECYLADARIYGRQLSGSEVDSIYNEGLSANYTTSTKTS